MADYSIKLGVELDTKKIDSQINSYKAKKPIEISTKLDTGNIDRELASYKAKNPIEVGVKLNTTGIAKKIGEYKPKTPVVLRAELNTADIDSAISSYEAKNKKIAIGVQLDTKEIQTEIQSYAAKAKPTIELEAKLNDKAIDTAIQNYKPKQRIKVALALNAADIEEKIGNYEARSPLRVKVKINKTDINQQLSQYDDADAHITVKAKLDNGAISEAIRNYKAKTPIKVDLTLDHTDIDNKVSTYAKSPIEIPVKLKPANKGFKDQISKTPVSIEATLKNPKDINDAINAYVQNPVLVPVKLTPAKAGFSDSVTKTPVQINATLNPEGINAAINKFAPTAKVNVDVKLNPKDINAQIKGLVKPTEPINVDIKLDESAINADIALFKPTATLGIQPDLILENVDDQIRAYVPKAKIKVNVKLDEDDINNATGNKGNQNPVTVNVKLDREKLNEQIRNFKTQTKIKVGVKLDSKGIAEQIRKIEPKTKIKVGTKLDKSDIDQQIQNISTSTPIKLGVELDPSGVQNIQNQIDDLRKQLEAIGNVSINLAGNRDVGNVSSGTNTGVRNENGGNISKTAHDFEVLTASVVNAKDIIAAMDRELGNLGVNLNGAKAGDITRDFQKMGIEIQKVVTSINGNDLKMKIVGVQETEDGIRRVVNLSKEYEGAVKNTGNISKTFTQTFETSTEAAKRIQKENAATLKEINQEMNEFVELQQRIGNKKVEIRMFELQGGDKNHIADLNNQLQNLEATYDRLMHTFMQKLSTNADILPNDAVDKFDEKITAVMQKTDSRLKALDSGALKEINQEMSKFVKLQSQIDSMKGEIGKLEAIGGKTNQVEELNRQLEELEATYGRLMGEFMKKLSDNADILPMDDIKNFESNLAAATQKAENELNKYKANLKDVQAETAKDIKINIDNGSLQNKIDAVEQKFNKLGITNQQVTNDIAELQRLLGNMDASDDIESVTNDYQTFLQLLKTVNNGVDGLQMQMDEANRPEILSAAKEAAMQRLNGLFENGSQAAKVFGSRAQELRNELNQVGNVKGVDIVNQKIKSLGTEIKNSTLQTKTFGSRLKEQFSRYSNYLSIASVFMYATQAARSMFEQVKLIDSAMTELKKVTNETDASYDKFLSNAATRAKEIGTTIDGLVSSTADFARLGYGFEDSQKLAEVANIYAVVGDEIDGVEGATESLISTLAAFKDEASGVSDADFAMNIIDIFNELGKLIA